jgi:lactate dehydrogenase-like 2-hydroxyacid dehydrogenase
MKIGYFGKKNSFAREMLRRLRLQHSRDEFLTWQPGDKVPSRELEVIIAFGKVDSKEIEAQTKLGLIQMASAGYEEVDVEAATKFGFWVGSAPTTKTGNGESVAELAVLLMLAASRRLNWPLHMRARKAGRRNGKGIGRFSVRPLVLWDWGESEICSSRDSGDSG